MMDNRDPFVDTSYSPPELRYAIRSARAVVEALIARDENAAEEAALRTCRDCDLLIRLIRELALLLRDPLNQQFGFDPVTTAALIRRADRVLALVDASPSRPVPSAMSDRDPNSQTAHAGQQCDGSSGKQPLNVESLSAPDVFQGPTVASLGLRVRLVPFEADDSAGVSAEKRHDDASPRLPSEVPPGIGDC